MTTEAAILLATEKAKALNISNPIIEPLELFLDGNSSITLDSFNEYHFIVSVDQGIAVESRYGRYCNEDIATYEKEILHRGHITITNSHAQSRNVTFIKLFVN